MLNLLGKGCAVLIGAAAVVWALICMVGMLLPLLFPVGCVILLWLFLKWISPKDPPTNSA